MVSKEDLILAQENDRLRRDIRILKEEQDILKKQQGSSSRAKNREVSNPAQDGCKIHSYELRDVIFSFHSNTHLLNLHDARMNSNNTSLTRALPTSTLWASPSSLRRAQGDKRSCEIVSQIRKEVLTQHMVPYGQGVRRSSIQCF